MHRKAVLWAAAAAVLIPLTSVTTVRAATLADAYTLRPLGTPDGVDPADIFSIKVEAANAVGQMIGEWKQLVPTDVDGAGNIQPVERTFGFFYDAAMDHMYGIGEVVDPQFWSTKPKLISDAGQVFGEWTTATGFTYDAANDRWKATEGKLSFSWDAATGVPVNVDLAAADAAGVVTLKELKVEAISAGGVLIGKSKGTFNLPGVVSGAEAELAIYANAADGELRFVEPPAWLAAGETVKKIKLQKESLGSSGAAIGEMELTNGTKYAISWTPAGGVVQLPALANAFGFTVAKAEAINASGYIVGEAATDGVSLPVETHAFFAKPGDVAPTDLGIPNPGDGRIGLKSSAKRISDSGWVIGEWESEAMIDVPLIEGDPGSVTSQPVRLKWGFIANVFDAVPTATDLGTIPDAFEIKAKGVTEDGRVYGEWAYWDGEIKYKDGLFEKIELEKRPFYYDATVGIVAIDLPTGVDESLVKAFHADRILDGGQVLLKLDFLDESKRTYLWLPDTQELIDIGSLVTDGTADGWQFTEIKVITEDGRLIGTGIDGDGVVSAFVLAPLTVTGVPAPTAAAMIAASLMMLAPRRRPRVRR